MKFFITIYTVFMVLLSANVYAESIRVTILGSGGPSTSPTRFGASTLVEAGKEKLLFDVGRGAIIRLEQNKTPLSDITVFLTHLHSDHINGLSDLWSVSYIAPTFRNKPLEIYGPTGINDVTSGIQTAYKPNINIRTLEYAEKGVNFYPKGATFDATEVKQEGVIFNRGGVKVSAIDVEHGEGRSFAYRVDYAGRSVVISGDTRMSKNLANKAKGTDIIIHEVMAVDEKLLKSSALFQSVLTGHTSPEDAALIFNDVKPKMAVFNHLILLGVSPARLKERTHKIYTGPLVIGQDLMTFIVDDEVSLINK
ncbi:MAG: MBL fold metallo-hydrolase [Pseudomonadales bacterium]|nr:MBL fold metallo-hydrolase [Pseudomonadales bacterium]